MYKNCLGLEARNALYVLVLGFSALASSAPSAGSQATGGQAADGPSTDAGTVATLPPPRPHWLFITDLVYSSFVVANVIVIDGDSGKMLGTISSGYMPNFVMTPDTRTIYMSETYYSRGSRGTRTDVLTAYDPVTLSARSELALPNGRFLTGVKKSALALGTDGKYLFSANMRPATSVSVIDLERGVFLKEIDTPGCFLVIPTGNASFASICGNGTLMNVALDGTGEAHKSSTAPFFNPETDPVFDAPALSTHTDHFYFVSYHGQIIPVDRSGGTAVPQSAWTIGSAAERRAGWRPGGYQLLALHPTSKRLYLLMHQGGEWTHKAKGTEVWVVDSETGRLLKRNRLRAPAVSIAVTLDTEPLLFSTDGAGTVGIYKIHGDSLTHQREVTEVGSITQVMSVPGEG